MIQRTAWNESMRGEFGYQLFLLMEKNPDVYLLTGDLGYKLFDLHIKHFPERVYNAGAAEQALVDISIGLALCGKIPFVYSITPFLLYRPFESLRTYINRESIKVILIGSGRNKDYHIDGFSHDATDARSVLNLFSNIRQYWPSTKEEIPTVISYALEGSKPSFISLKR